MNYFYKRLIFLNGKVLTKKKNVFFVPNPIRVVCTVRLDAEQPSAREFHYPLSFLSEPHTYPLLEINSA